MLFFSFEIDINPVMFTNIVYELKYSAKQYGDFWEAITTVLSDSFSMT